MTVEMIYRVNNVNSDFSYFDYALRAAVENGESQVRVFSVVSDDNDLYEEYEMDSIYIDDLVDALEPLVKDKLEEMMEEDES